MALFLFPLKTAMASKQLNDSKSVSSSEQELVRKDMKQKGNKIQSFRKTFGSCRTLLLPVPFPDLLLPLTAGIYPT